QPRRRLELLLVDDLACGGVLAIDDPARITGPVEVAVVIDRRGDVGPFPLPPEFVGPGHVAASAGPDRPGGAPPAHSGGDALMRHHTGADITMNAIGTPQLLARIRIQSQ